jgi:lipoic acid synthetase
MHDLADSGCDILTLGQYLAPSQEHFPVKEFVSIEKFERLHDIAQAVGFKAVLSGPLVRSSYKAEEVFNGLQRV